MSNCLRNMQGPEVLNTTMLVKYSWNFYRGYFHTGIQIIDVIVNLSFRKQKRPRIKCFFLIVFCLLVHSTEKPQRFGRTINKLRIKHTWLHTFGAICLQFFRQSFMQSGWAAAASFGNKAPTPSAAAKAPALKSILLLVESTTSLVWSFANNWVFDCFWWHAPLVENARALGKMHMRSEAFMFDSFFALVCLLASVWIVFLRASELASEWLAHYFRLRGGSFIFCKKQIR